MPISLSSSVFAARCSSVLTLTLYFGSVMVAVTCLVPILSQYGRPGSIGSSDIQTRAASNWSATPGRSDGAAMMSPRLQSISSASASVMAWPATARSRSPSIVTMRVTCALAARGQHAHLVAGVNDAADDRAGEAAEVEVRAIDPLHRQAKRPVPRLVLDIDGLEVPHQRRAVIPGRVVAAIRDVVALEPGDRDRDDVLEPDLLRELLVLLEDRRRRSRANSPSGPSC